MGNILELKSLSGLHEQVRYKKGDVIGVLGIVMRRDNKGILLVHHEESNSWRLPFGLFVPGDGNWVQAVMRMVPRSVVLTFDYIDLNMRPIGLAKEVSRLSQVAVAVAEISPSSLARFPTQRHAWVKSAQEFDERYSPWGDVKRLSAMKLLVLQAFEKGAIFTQAQ